MLGDIGPACREPWGWKCSSPVTVRPVHVALSTLVASMQKVKSPVLGLRKMASVAGSARRYFLHNSGTQMILNAAIG